jgi:hypothetical protein
MLHGDHRCATLVVMPVEYPHADRIRELVEAAPELTPSQINKLRLLLQTAHPSATHHA